PLLDFGSHDFNETAQLSFTVSPTTTALIIESPGVTFSGASAGSFSLISSHTFPIYLFPDGSHSVTFDIEYATGSSSSVDTATATVVTSLVADPEVSLMGQTPPVAADLAEAKGMSLGESIVI